MRFCHPGTLKEYHKEYPTCPHYPPLRNLKHSLGYGRQRLLQLKPSTAVPYSCCGDQMIGHQFQARTSDPSPLGGVLDWWLVKLSQRLCFPPEIATANLRPDSSLPLTSQGLYDGAESKSLRYTEEKSIVSWLLPGCSRIWECEAKSNTKPKLSQAQMNREARRSSSDAEGH